MTIGFAHPAAADIGGAEGQILDVMADQVKAWLQEAVLQPQKDGRPDLFGS
jgi:hypothetical protein